MGWFFGFKLHLLINYNCEILAMKITTGNENDPMPVIDLCKNLTEKLYADKGYIGKALTEKLKTSDIDSVITVLKAKVIYAFNKVILSKRYIIEIIND